jgi:hypothetical protein
MAITKKTPASSGGSGPAVVKKVKVSLPTKRTVPPTNINAYTWYIYGLQKIGKTSLSMQFPDCLHIFFEPSGKDYSLFEVHPDSWEEFRAYIDLCKEKKKEGTLEFKTFSIDTVDLCWEMCCKFIATKNGVDTVADMQWGTGWNAAKDEFRGAMIDLAKLGGLVALSHETSTQVEKKTGEKYTFVSPSLQNAANQVLAKFFDITGYYRTDDRGGRELLVQSSPDAECGNRLNDHFKYTNGSKMKSIPMGDTPEEAYSNIQKAFDNKFSNIPIEEPKPKTLKLKKEN